MEEIKVHFGCVGDCLLLLHLADVPSILQIDVAEGRELKEQDQRDADDELQVLGLVTPDAHSQPSSDAATYDSKQQQCRLWYAPEVLLGLVFVDAIDDEGDDIDCKDVIDKDLDVEHKDLVVHI